VEWVHKNIESFGGDPDRVILWGQSAGAMAVDFYNFAYPTNPLVSGLIMDSGSALTVALAEDSTHADFTFIAGKVGCGNLSAAAELDCMHKVPAQTIQTAAGQYAHTVPGVNFWPRVDGKTVFSNYTARALAGNFTTLVCSRDSFADMNSFADLKH
jgi:carboxylesterase type B